MADFESVRTRLETSYVNPEEDHPYKYFHESTFHPHYDGRFGDRILKYDEQQAHLKALIQTYLSTMNSIGAETWLMHGTLLGWYWNRKVMPWDSDLDVMVSEKSLHFLASYHNMTMHSFKLPGQKRTRTYLLEINPNYREGEVDEENRIDARWIDTEIGLFIDITTLRRNRSADDEEAMMVKDKHHYMLDDIYPLRDSTFEGIPVWIPYAYPDILSEEYGQEALSGTNHEHHRFDAERQTWIPQKILDSKFDGDDG
ncbi:hypothetical protein PRZ48_005429 [Zasmidium cellare]|uniref:LicD/FKTN/FKRP nucleotidyltransferase domain-containing protein n=1 Tax=Zasmidium cellare TaxID=395010 RepID=A0ABR0ETL1_ZASCE|nr:hypothetical protein PRZ48_005429 [Zasmidium cellare]